MQVGGLVAPVAEAKVPYQTYPVGGCSSCVHQHVRSSNKFVVPFVSVFTVKCLVPESVNYQSSNDHLLSDVQFHPPGPEKPPNKPSSLVWFCFKIGDVFLDVSEQRLFTKILKNAHA